MGMVIFAFTASGKTYYCSKHSDSIELGSEKYHWLDYAPGEQMKGHMEKINPQWPENYLKAIIEAKSKYKYVFVTKQGSTLCEKAGIPYTLIYPSEKCKKDFITRMKKRGNTIEVINNMEFNFVKYVESCKNNTYPEKKIELAPGDYLTDAIDTIEYEQYAFSGVRKKNEKIKEFVDKGLITACLFFSPHLDEYMEELGGIIVGSFKSASDRHNIYKYKNAFYIVPMLGSANAAGLMEELIACGIKQLIAVGPAGKLSAEYSCDFLIPNQVIDESGINGAYNSDSECISPSEALSEKIANLLIDQGVHVKRGTVWTTQAYYRETPKIIKNKLEKGAVAVDMECGAWCHVALFRNVDFSQVFYFSDSIDKASYGRYINRREKNDFLMRLMIDLAAQL